MVTVPVHKDILSYEPKVAFILTKRTLVFTGIALVAGLLMGLLTLVVLGLPMEIAVYPICGIAFPVWAVGFARPFKMRPEELAPFWLRSTFTNQELHYVSTPALAGRKATECMPSDVRRHVVGLTDETYIQRHYKKLRTSQGIETYDPGIDLMETNIDE